MLFFVGRGRAFRLTLSAVMLSTAACASGVAGGSPVSAPEPAAPPDFQTRPAPQPKQRTRPASPKPATTPRLRVDSAALELAVTRRHAHLPLALALARRTRRPEVADRAASAVVREAERLQLSPSLLAAVLLIENAPLDTSAVSSQGAIGLMQIMPVHIGSFGCGTDLLNVESNICHGARLLKNLVRRTGSMQVALKRYNGCVRGRNTPRCHRYPGRVLRTASKLRREVLATAGDATLEVQEALAATARARAVAIPSQPVTDSDSASTAGSVTAQCASFFGCLRYRWTLTN